MTKLTLFSSPLMLGFDQIERLINKAERAGNDGYPPYNIEQLGEAALRISLAVAGFAAHALTVAVEDNQLTIRGRQQDEPGKTYLHRGIAARQFQRNFVLADGLEVVAANLDHGLLHIDLARPKSTGRIQTIKITTGEPRVSPGQEPGSSLEQKGTKQ